MRVIAGEYKGRKLESPIGNDVRPTADKVKEAIFSTVLADVPESICVDLFAGSGGLGIEALSRGASRVYFGDNSQDSMSLVKQNCRICKCSDKAIFFLGDWKKVLGRVADEANGRVNLVFLDPPYHEGLMEKVIVEIDKLDLMEEDGILVCEHDKKDQLPEKIGRFVCLKERSYAKTAVSYYGLSKE